MVDPLPYVSLEDTLLGPKCSLSYTIRAGYFSRTWYFTSLLSLAMSIFTDFCICVILSKYYTMLTCC